MKPLSCFLVAVIDFLDKSNFRGENIYSGSRFQAVVHHGRAVRREFEAAGFVIFTVRKHPSFQHEKKNTEVQLLFFHLSNPGSQEQNRGIQVGSLPSSINAIKIIFHPSGGGAYF